MRLIPLAEEHAAPLYAIARKPGVWEWKPHRMEEPQHMEGYVQAALTERQQGSAQPFAILARDSGLVLGTTRFGSMALQHRRVEIGWTFLDPDVWRTAVNTECKRLLLGFAFERLECLRVELKTDLRNLRSRTAIERLGAKQEGILRSHILYDDGRVRDTVYYSILSDEWPAVRAELDRRLSP